MKISKSSLLLLTLISAIFVFGVVGYSVIEGWSLIDSVYMTMITITTTGYQEVQPLSPEGRMFTMLLLVCGVGTVAYSASFFMKDLFSMDFTTRRRIKMLKQIHEQKNHIIICGYGRMGRVICNELTQFKENFIIIESNPDAVKELENSDYLWLEGDATNDKTLITAGIDRAKTLVSMVDNDSDSLYISLAGRSLNDNLYIVSRASDEDAKLKILRAGADKVILPVLVSGLKAAQSIITPEVDDLLDIDGLNLNESNRVQVAEIPVTLSSKLYDSSLRDCGIKLGKVIVIGIRHKDESFTFVPESDYKFKNGDTLITLSTADSFNDVKEKHAS